MSSNWERDSDHPIVAALYDPVMALPERLVFGEHREWLARGLRGDVLDIGSGTGAMFPHFTGQEALSVHAVEPDPHMRKRAIDRGQGVDLDVEVVNAVAEDLPYPEDSLDAVVTSLVLCTVDDVDAALDEIARVLRPGGELRFLEHVRGRGGVGPLHDVLAPGWFHVAGGCNLNRRTGDRLSRDDRFELLEYDRYESGLSRLVPLVRGRLERRRESLLPIVR